MEREVKVKVASDVIKHQTSAQPPVWFQHLTQGPETAEAEGQVRAKEKEEKRAHGSVL